MPLTDVYRNLIDIKAESRKLAKVALLKKYLKDPVFTSVVDMALSHDKVYHTKSFGEYDHESPGGTYREIMEHLIWMSQQTGAKLADKAKLRRLASVNEETFYVIQCIVAKTLRCGADARLINEAVPDTVFTVPYMRCFTEKKGLHRIHYNGGAFCQKKADGGFAYGMIDWDSKEPYLMTRNGHSINLHGELDKDLELLRKGDEVLTMELTAVDEDGNDLPRELGNGLITKALRGTITKKEAKLIRGQAWDVIPQTEFWEGFYGVEYEARWRRTTRLTRSMRKINRIQSRRVYSEEEAREFFLMMRREGLEGAILKNNDGPWKSHESPNQVKLKRKFCAEFRVTGWYYGDDDKKYRKCLGGLRFESLCGLVKCNTGSGFSDEDRGRKRLPDGKYAPLNEDGYYDADQSVLDEWTKKIKEGLIISVEFDSLVTDKDRDDDYLFALFLPIFDRERPDKDDADDLEYLETL